jgi:hypothetical protein
MRFTLDNDLSNEWEIGSGPPIGTHSPATVGFSKQEDGSDAISLQWKKYIQDEILAVAADCSSPGWDGDNSAPIRADAVSSAFKLIYLAPDWIQPPAISPSPDGELAFEWRAGNKLLSMYSRGDEIIFAAILGSPKDREMGIKPVSKGWPQSAVRILAEHFANVSSSSAAA